MGLTEAERSSLRITTIGAIDVTKAERLAKRKERAKARAKELRAERSQRSRKEYLDTAISRTKPWEAKGISRRTWYRRRKLAQVPCAP
jgi:sRNA-binding protein